MSFCLPPSYANFSPTSGVVTLSHRRVTTLTLIDSLGLSFRFLSMLLK
jgi:hypothetical protein